MVPHPHARHRGRATGSRPWTPMGQDDRPRFPEPGALDTSGWHWTGRTAPGQRGSWRYSHSVDPSTLSRQSQTTL